MDIVFPIAQRKLYFADIGFQIQITFTKFITECYFLVLLRYK